MRGGKGDLPARSLSSVASVVHLPRRGGGGLQRGDSGGTRRSRRLRQPLVQPRARHRLLRRGVGVGAARVGLGARERHQCAGRATRRRRRLRRRRRRCGAFDGHEGGRRREWRADGGSGGGGGGGGRRARRRLFDECGVDGTQRREALRLHLGMLLGLKPWQVRRRDVGPPLREHHRLDLLRRRGRGARSSRGGMGQGQSTRRGVRTLVRSLSAKPARSMSGCASGGGARKRDGRALEADGRRSRGGGGCSGWAGTMERDRAAAERTLTCPSSERSLPAVSLACRVSNCCCSKMFLISREFARAS